MTAVCVKIGPKGLPVVPAGLRKEIGLDGTSVLLEAVKGALRVQPMEGVVLRARERLRRFPGDRSSLADDLIAERRAEASRGQGRSPTPLRRGSMSAVNPSEMAAKLIQASVPDNEAVSILRREPVVIADAV